MAFYTPPRTPNADGTPPSLPRIAHLDRQLPAIDWLDVSRTRPAHFVAERTCEMICYLWFAPSAGAHSYPTPTSSPPFAQRPSAATTALQLVARPTFVQFMHKLLETTQVSQSVIVLSLHYIYRLKDRNRFTPAQPGSEFRIAVAALMMANKFLDDNTYTNKTWSEVSGIELAEINRMEKEFLTGVDFNLYVDKSTYESWLNLLKGLVLAKERDSRLFRTKSRPPVRAAAPRRHALPRARSTSPTHTRPAAPPSGSKRSADAAFSPTPAHACKRQLRLHIPADPPHRDHSPSDGLQSFATMSLASPRWPHRHVLVTPYSERSTSVPQNLYFYTLACSPMDRDQDSYTHARKARLRYHAPSLSTAASASYPHPHPHPHPAYAYYHPQHASVVQSASTSPVGVYTLGAGVRPTSTSTTTTLPHFHETQWTRPPSQSRVQQHTPTPTPTFSSSTTKQKHKPHTHTPSVPSAPFANAGPPGVHGAQFCEYACEA